tara:strand:+ start:835 stop:996 length:162 start_codon:yes stop_codon:yes gene_type:complete
LKELLEHVWVNFGIDEIKNDRDYDEEYTTEDSFDNDIAKSWSHILLWWKQCGY